MSDPVQLSWPTYPEEFVIRELLKSSEVFQAFYQVERRKISGDVYWAHDPTMPEGIDYRSTRIFRAGVQIAQVVRLRRVPAVIEDALKIAHELEHLVLHAEGFLGTHAISPNHETLSSALNSMLTDPLVDSRLRDHGFELRADYETELEEDIRQLSQFTGPPSQRLQRTSWMFNYVGKILYWEMLDTGEEHSKFQVWFDPRFPYIASRGKKLLLRVKRTGYDNPDKQSQIFQDIIKRYKLTGVIGFP
jgi:hypothetical protein